MRRPALGFRILAFEASSRDLVVMTSCAKGGGDGALRGFARTSNIKLFSFRPRSRAGLPRQPIRGGALTDPIKRKIDSK